MNHDEFEKQRDKILELIDALKVQQERTSTKIQLMQDDLSIIREETEVIGQLLKNIVKKTEQI